MNKYFFIFICLPFLISSCSKTEKPISSTEVESLISGIKIAERDSNQYQWDLNSKKARLNEKNGSMIFSNPDLRFYKDNKIVSTITADKGELNMKPRDTELTGNVIVNSKNENSVLKTKKLLLKLSLNTIIPPVFESLGSLKIPGQIKGKIYL